MNISESLAKVLESKEVLGNAFYETFFQRYPEVQRYFEGINMQRQAVLLTIALSVVEQYFTHAYPATQKYLQYLGTKHSDRSIPQDLYAKWCDAMLDTLKEFHNGQWDDQLARQWREAIERSVAVMMEGYGQRFTV